MGYQCGNHDVLCKTTIELLRKKILRLVDVEKKNKLFFHSLTSPSSIFYRKFWNGVAFEGVSSTTWL